MPRLYADLSYAKTCAKCGATPTHRHHKGCDGLLGVYNRTIRDEYALFKDCVNLCFECHMVIHYIYDIHYLFGWDPSSRAALVLRPLLIRLCERWLNGEVPTPRVPKARRQKFERSSAKWKKASTNTTSDPKDPKGPR